jgi:hypothetical protein
MWLRRVIHTKWNLTRLRGYGVFDQTKSLTCSILYLHNLRTHPFTKNTRERKVGIITNTNDTYEDNEGATSNQRNKGNNYGKYK